MDIKLVQDDAPKPGLWMRFLMKIAGVDGETLMQCPPADWANVRAVGEIMTCTWLYQAALFALIGHRLFAQPGHIRPDVIAISMFIAIFILFVDSYMVMRSGWHLSGIAELKRGGLDISGGPFARVKAALFLAVRIGLSIGLAQLTAIFVSLLIFAGDINSRIEDSYLKANAHLIGPATVLVDGAIQRATEAVTTQSAQVNGLSAQIAALRQSEIDPTASDPQIQQAQQELAQLVDRKAKADEETRSAETFAANEFGSIKGAVGNSGRPGYGLRYRAAMDQVANARARARQIEKELNAARARVDTLRQQLPPVNDAIKQQTNDRLLGFEGALKMESATLTGLKSELAALTAGRESAIRRAVDNAPDHVAHADGFLAQIVVLEHIAQEDTKIALVILLIDIISFGFELAGVLAKVTSYIPTTYAAILARDAYMRVVRIADAMTTELDAIESGRSKLNENTEPATPAYGSDDAAATPPPNPFTDAKPAETAPPRRPRGRPRKHPLPTDSTTANGPEDLAPRQDQQAPA